MSMSLTATAAEKVLASLQERGGGLGIRVSVISSECSGLAYKLLFVDRAEADDSIFESHGARLYVDAKSLPWLEGTVIDYLQLEDQEGFLFRNPNVSHQCGCGDSFYV